MLGGGVVIPREGEKGADECCVVQATAGGAAAGRARRGVRGEQKERRQPGHALRLPVSGNFFFLSVFSCSWLC